MSDLYESAGNLLSVLRERFGKKDNILLKIRLVPSLSTIPEKGKSIGSINSSTGTVWNGKMWLSQDAFDATQPVPTSIRLPAETDAAKILNSTKKLSGSLDIKKHLPEIEDLFAKYYAEQKVYEKDNLDAAKNEMTVLRKKIIETWEKVNSENLEALKSREEALKEIDETLKDKDILHKIKSVYLRTKTREEAHEAIEKAVKKSPEEKEHAPKEEKEKPTKDEKKEKFSDKDREYILKIIHDQSEKGTPTITRVIDDLKDIFNKDLLNELTLAATKFGGIPGLKKYLSPQYMNLRNELKKNVPKLEHPAISQTYKGGADKIESYLDKVKKSHPAIFKQLTFHKYSKEVLDLFLRYQKSRSKNLAFEQYLHGVFTGRTEKKDEKDEVVIPHILGLIQGWNRLKIESMVSGFKSLDDSLPSESKETITDPALLVKDEDKDKEVKSPHERSEYGDELHKLVMRYAPDITEDDKEVVKDMKKDVKENLKNTEKEETEYEKEENLKKKLDEITEYGFSRADAEKIHKLKQTQSNKQAPPADASAEDKDLYKSYWQAMDDADKNLGFDPSTRNKLRLIRNKKDEGEKLDDEEKAFWDELKKRTKEYDAEQKRKHKEPGGGGKYSPSKPYKAPQPTYDKKEKEEQEAKEKREEKKSSSNIVDEYKTTVQYRLEKTANLTHDSLLKAEILDIARTLKNTQ